MVSNDVWGAFNWDCVSRKVFCLMLRLNTLVPFAIVLALNAPGVHGSCHIFLWVTNIVLCLFLSVQPRKTVLWPTCTKL